MRMTLVGKIFMVLFFLSLGFGGGVIYGYKHAEKKMNEGISNDTYISINKLKAKENSKITLDTENSQKASQTKTDETTDEDKGFFKRLFD